MTADMQISLPNCRPLSFRYSTCATFHDHLSNSWALVCFSIPFYALNKLQFSAVLEVKPEMLGLNYRMTFTRPAMSVNDAATTQPLTRARNG